MQKAKNLTGKTWKTKGEVAGMRIVDYLEETAQKIDGRNSRYDLRKQSNVFWSLQVKR